MDDRATQPWLPFLLGPALAGQIAAVLQVPADRREFDDAAVCAWEARIAPRFFSSSGLDPARQASIVEQISCDMDALVQLRSACLDRLRSTSAPSASGWHRTPAWSSMNTTRSEAGWRLQVGLNNQGCSYWREAGERIGCLNCGFFLGTTPGLSPTSEDYVAQVQLALERVPAPQRKMIDTLELNGDGSFFNCLEVDSASRVALASFVASRPSLRRLHVESRPEFVTVRATRELLSSLRDDQRLSVGMGLESADPFVRELCVRKGFTFDDFSAAADRICQSGSRASACCYLLVKPAYLTEGEALADTRRGIASMADLQTSGLRVDVKLEPGVVASGTILDLLSRKPSCHGSCYCPPSSWTILELLLFASKAAPGLDVLVGAREDMDVVSQLPAARLPDGTMSPIDIALYDAIQATNALADIGVLARQAADVAGDPSLVEWKRNVGSGREPRLSLPAAIAATVGGEPGPSFALRRGLRRWAIDVVRAGLGSPSAEHLVPDVSRRLLEGGGRLDKTPSEGNGQHGRILRWRLYPPDGHPLDIWVEAPRPNSARFAVDACCARPPVGPEPPGEGAE